MIECDSVYHRGNIGQSDTDLDDTVNLYVALGVKKPTQETSGRMQELGRYLCMGKSSCLANFVFKYQIFCYHGIRVVREHV